MIRNSLVVALMLLLVYHFFYPAIPKKFYRLNGQQRQNYDRAQNYVFGAGEEGHVIIGSSMSHELNPTILGPDWRKFTFPGCSVLTAVEIMSRADKRPPVLLIETNQCFDANQDILGDLFNPVMSRLRNQSPIFLEEGRPSNFVAGIAEVCVRDTCKIGSSLISKCGLATPPEMEARPNPELFSQVLDRLRGEFAEAESPGPLNERIAQIGNFIDELRSKGGICILFEMPIDSSLVELRLPVSVRNAMQARFPSDRYDWLTFDRNHHYQTSDGIHLVRDEADRLTEVIIPQVGEIVRKRNERVTALDREGSIAGEGRLVRNR